MFQRILDNFDIDTSGWFEQDANNKRSILNRTSEITDKIWSLWAVNPMQVNYVDVDRMANRSIVSAIEAFAGHMRRWVEDHKRQPKPVEKRAFIRNLLVGYKYGAIYENPTLGYVPERGDKESINIPSGLVSDRMLDLVPDIYTLADAITGYGLESMERDNACLNIGYDGIMFAHQLIQDTNLPPELSGFTQTETILADCTLDIWYAACVRDIRSKILTQWPGWHSIFAAQDSVLLPPTEDMHTTVKTKSKYRCELRRFCMALAWNLNAQPSERIPFPRQFKAAYDMAVATWPYIIAQPRDTEAHLTAINALVKDLAEILSTEEEKPKRTSTPRRGSSGLGLKGTPDKDQTHHRKIHHGGDSHIEPAKDEADADPDFNESAGTPPPAVFYDIMSPDEIARLVGKHTALVGYREQSQKLQDKVRSAIAESISAAAWYVAAPPPSEHAQLQGMLDEGSLLNLAAFNDPHIFSTPPEAGHGHIAIAVLVDSSSSMGAHVYPLAHNPETGYGPTHNVMQEAMAFLAGLKDGLARASNVSLCSFAYQSGTLSDQCIHTKCDSSADTVNATVCSMRRLDSEDALLLTQSYGGTPSATGIKAASDYLHTHYPDATKLIIHLTDGAPCGGVDDPYHQQTMFNDNVGSVRSLVNNLPIPVFAVGFGYGVDAHTMREQYNHDKWFTVQTPLDAVPIACQLITGIGQCLANR